jgi:hypothetical protein
MSENMWFSPSCFWLVSLNTMISSATHVGVSDRISFFFTVLSNIPFYYFILFLTFSEFQSSSREQLFLQQVLWTSKTMLGKK